MGFTIESEQRRSAKGAFWRAVLQVRPDLYKAFNPWDRISNPGSLRYVLGKGGVEPDEVTVEKGGTRLDPARTVDHC
jgi:hypothetical protein